MGHGGNRFLLLAGGIGLAAVAVFGLDIFMAS
jgi:hypothetical protein